MGSKFVPEVMAAQDRIAVASSQVQENAAHSEAARQADQAPSVSAPPTFTMRWLIPRLSCFQHQHPSVEVVKLAASLAPVDIAASKAAGGVARPRPVPGTLYLRRKVDPGPRGPE